MIILVVLLVENDKYHWIIFPNHFFFDKSVFARPMTNVWMLGFELGVEITVMCQGYNVLK